MANSRVARCTLIRFLHADRSIGARSKRGPRNRDKWSYFIIRGHTFGDHRCWYLPLSVMKYRDMSVSHWVIAVTYNLTSYRAN